jgi:hypothetical protein
LGIRNGLITVGSADEKLLGDDAPWISSIWCPGLNRHGAKYFVLWFFQIQCVTARSAGAFDSMGMRNTHTRAH